MKEKDLDLEKEEQETKNDNEGSLDEIETTSVDEEMETAIDDEISEKTDEKDEETIKHESADDIQLLEEKVVPEEDKYIKLTPRRFYATVIIAPVLVFITMIALIFGGNYIYQEVQISKQVDEMIQNALASATNGSSVDSALDKGMIAVIDYKGTVNGKEFNGGTGEDYSLVIGSGTFIDNFEDQLIGHKKGDKLNVKVTFPDDYTTEDLAGKDAVFKVTIKDVQEQVENKLNNDFVESLGISGVTTVDQLKDYLRDYIKSQSASTPAQ